VKGDVRRRGVAGARCVFALIDFFQQCPDLNGARLCRRPAAARWIKKGASYIFHVCPSARAASGDNSRSEFQMGTFHFFIALEGRWHWANMTAQT
jgi:hypothetical protein